MTNHYLVDLFRRLVDKLRGRRRVPEWTIGPIIDNKSRSPGMPWNLYYPGYFDFPQKDGVHYVTRPAPAKRPTQFARIVFRLDGAGTLKATEGTDEAQLRLFMMVRGESWGAGSNGRWWSNPQSLKLWSPGEYKLEVPIDPDYWTQTSGQHDDASFRIALDHLECVGFTCGGTFFGHGVFASGKVRFTLLEFSVV